MSYQIYDANGFVCDFASGGGLRDLFGYLRQQKNSDIKRLAHDGEIEITNEIKTEIKNIKPPTDTTIASTLNILQSAATKCEEILIISDGMTNDNEKSISKVEAKSMNRTTIRKSLPVTIRKDTLGNEEIVINSGMPDRGGDRVFADGVDISDWQKNPVVMWLHDYKGATPAAGIPLGTGTTIRAVNGELVAGAINWLEKDPFVDRVRNAWNQNVLRTVSIGFEPPEDAGDMPRNDFGGIDYKKCKLLEYSIVPIPMDADALRRKSFPDLVEGKHSQKEISDELDYALSLIKDWNFNESNQVLIKSIHDELSKRYPVSDMTVNIKSSKIRIKHAMDACKSAMDVMSDHDKAHAAAFDSHSKSIIRCYNGLKAMYDHETAPDGTEGEHMIDEVNPTEPVGVTTLSIDDIVASTIKKY